MSIQGRLKSVRNDIASSPEVLVKELEGKFSISAQTIYSYENGRREPSLGYLEALVKYYDINPIWLLNGQGEKFLNKDGKILTSIPTNVDLENTVFIPIVDMNISAGHGSLVDAGKENAKDFISFTKEWLSKITSVDAKYLLGFIVKGDSMQGEINDGDVIIVNTLNNEMSNDGTYAINIDNKLYVKTLQQRPGGKIRVISANSKYEPFTVDLNTEYFNIIGNVVWSGGRRDVC